MVSRIPDEKLKEDIQRVYSKLDEPPSESQYAEHGKYSVSVVRNRFGRFTKGREAAGIPNPDMRGGQNRIERDDLLEAIHKLADELGREPTSNDMRDKGRYGTKAYRREFGSWTEAILEAGYTPYRPASDIAEREEVECPNCGTVETRLKSQIEGQREVFCSQDCLFEHRSEHRSGENHPLYDRVEVRCSSCGKKQRRRPSVVNNREDIFCDLECYSNWCSESRTGKSHPRWMGGGDLYYGPNWHSQRRRRLQKDEYKCQRCGMNLNQHRRIFDRDLDVHHLKSVREFYEESADGDPDWDEVNKLENLVTLCFPCHRKIEKLPVRPQVE